MNISVTPEHLYNLKHSIQPLSLQYLWNLNIAVNNCIIYSWQRRYSCLIDIIYISGTDYYYYYYATSSRVQSSSSSSSMFPTSSPSTRSLAVSTTTSSSEPTTDQTPQQQKQVSIRKKFPDTWLFINVTAEYVFVSILFCLLFLYFLASEHSIIFIGEQKSTHIFWLVFK